MKKLYLAVALFAASALAQAATAVCSGTAGAGTAVTGAGANFIQNDVTPRCSNNVHVSYEQSAQAVGVGASSSKGASVFSGNSEGGGVTGAFCTDKRCAGTEAAGAATAALAAAASS